MKQSYRIMISLIVACTLNKSIAMENQIMPENNGPAKVFFDKIRREEAQPQFPDEQKVDEFIKDMARQVNEFGDGGIDHHIYLLQKDKILDVTHDDNGYVLTLKQGQYNKIAGYFKTMLSDIYENH